MGVGGKDVVATQPVPALEDAVAPLHGKNQVPASGIQFFNRGIVEFMPPEQGAGLEIGIVAIHLHDGVAMPLGTPGETEYNRKNTGHFEGTFREVQKKNPHFKDLDSPRWNIAAGIYYDRLLYKRWVSPPPGEERLYFAFGSYNAGYTRIKNTFQRLDPPEAAWEHVEHHVPGQTRYYVRRIRRLMERDDSDG